VFFIKFDYDFNDVVRRLHSGDASAFDEIYARCCAPIAFLCRKFCDNPEDAEEVVQDTFIIAYKKKNELLGDTLLAYLKKIAIHQCFDKRKKQTYQQSFIYSFDDVTDDIADSDVDFLPAESLQNKERQRELLQIINQLPRNQREITYLYYYFDFNTEEIAVICNCTSMNVRKILQRARAAIRARLEGKPLRKPKTSIALVAIGTALGALIRAEEQVFAAAYIPTAACYTGASATMAAATTAAAATSTATALKVCVMAACLITAGFVATALHTLSELSAETDVYHDCSCSPVLMMHESPPHTAPPIEAPTEPPPQTTEPPEPPYTSQESEHIEPPTHIEEPLPTIPPPTLPPTTTVAATPEPTAPPITIPPATEPPTPPPAEPPPAPIDRTAEIMARLANAHTPAAVDAIIQEYGFAYAASMHSFTGMALRFYSLDDGSGDILIGTGVYDDGSGWYMRFDLFAIGQMPVDILQRLRFMEQ